MEEEVSCSRIKLIDLDFVDLRCLFSRTIRDKNAERLKIIMEIVGENGYRPLADHLSYKIYDSLSENWHYLEKWLEWVFAATNFDRKFYIILLCKVINSGGSDKTPYLMKMLKNDYQLLFDALYKMKDDRVFDSLRFYRAARTVYNNLMIPRSEEKIQEEMSRGIQEDENMSCGRLLLYGATSGEIESWKRNFNVAMK